MSTRPLRKQAGGTEEAARAQNNVENVLGGLRNAVILDGTLIENVLVGTGATLVAHKLGRPIQGYLVVRRDNFGVIAEVTGTFDKNLFINLMASTPTTVSLWIF